MILSSKEKFLRNCHYAVFVCRVIYMHYFPVLFISFSLACFSVAIATKWDTE